MSTIDYIFTGILVLAAFLCGVSMGVFIANAWPSLRKEIADRHAKSLATVDPA